MISVLIEDEGISARLTKILVSVGNIYKTKTPLFYWCLLTISSLRGPRKSREHKNKMETSFYFFLANLLRAFLRRVKGGRCLEGKKLRERGYFWEIPNRFQPNLATIFWLLWLTICLKNLPIAHLFKIETTIATFRLGYEDECEHEFTVLTTRFRFGGPQFLKCACWRSLVTIYRVFKPTYKRSLRSI